MSINIKEKSKVILAKVQAAVGTPETLDATNILRTSNLQMSIYDGNTTEIDYDGGSGRDSVTKHTDAYNKFSFEADLIGGGDAGAGAIDPPPMADVIRACGYDMNTATLGEVVFTPSTRDSLDVVTVEVLRQETDNGDSTYDVYKYTTSDARGQLGLSFSDDRMKFVVTDLTGGYVLPTPVAANAFQPKPGALTVTPKPFTNSSTNSLTYNGVALCMHALNIPSLGWSVAPVDKPNCDDVQLQEEKIVIEATFKSTDWNTEFNPYALQEDTDTISYNTFEMSIDDRVGHIFKLNCEARLMGVQEVELEDGNLGYQVQLEVEDADFQFGFYASV